ncbi:hypothetical protein V8G54_012289 [Vigna mungo]|uniref:Uncharacterized protein n=1 Tax=Vigna mungo TaxID=3915 RepID=A0AAQ3NUF3_VIGMU
MVVETKETTTNRLATWHTHDGSVGCNSLLKTPLYEHSKPRSVPHNLRCVVRPFRRGTKNTTSTFSGFSAGELVAEHDVPPSTGLVQCRHAFQISQKWHDVRACEYEDIQVMWEMLNRNESNKNNSNNKKKGQCWKLLNWARCAPYYYMCRRG